MSAQLQADGAGSRPNLSGDLGEVFQAAPMFRRAVSGYDRFQVESYVQWAEGELASADRERERLLERHLRAQASLADAQRLLSHSAAGGKFLQVSDRIGAMLAAAADEAEGMRAEADAERCAASTQAERTVADAERVLAAAETEAERLLAEAAAGVHESAAEAARIVQEAEQAGSEARAEAQARLDKVRVIEQRAAEHAEQLRRQAAEEAAAARLNARDEVVRLLTTGREERRRADAEAAATRERQDRDAATRAAALRAEADFLEHRRAALVAEVAALEHRNAALRDEGDWLAGPAGGRPTADLRPVTRLHWRPRSLRTH